MFRFKFNFNFVPVSADFIENYMSVAHGEYVKVYLHILYMAVRGEEAQPKKIANKLNLLESDVMNAIEYWQEKGILSSDGETIIAGAVTETISSKAEDAESSGYDSPKSNYTAGTHDPAKTKKTAAQINADPLANKKLAEINEMAQSILERPINDKDISTLYWFYEELDFSAELIMMLLEHCVSLDKKDMRYIEKVAIKWHEQGIKDMEGAVAYMKAEEEKKRFSNELKAVFGIYDRGFTGKEEAYISKWHDELGMSAEMIALAYEYCAMATNKLSFQYMDRIIRNWSKQGISTVDAAEKEHEEFKRRGKKFGDKDSSVYKSGDTDYDEIERRMNEKY